MLLSKPTVVGGGELKWPTKNRNLARQLFRELGQVELPGNEQSTGQPHRGPGRRPSRDRAFYEEIAADYLRWSGSSPARKIAEKHGVNPSTARNFIHTARHKFHLLPATDPGYESLIFDAVSQSARRPSSQASKQRKAKP